MMRGFTVTETLVSIAILIIIGSISVATYASFAQKEEMDAAVSTALAMLRDARAQTIASVGGSQYGVEVEQDRFVLFKGSEYVSTATSNRPFVFGSRVKASSSEPFFLFERVTGDASQSGMIDVYLASDPSTKKTIVVQGTGLVSVE